MGIHGEEGGLTFALIERKTPVLRPALQLKQSPCEASTALGTKGEVDQMARSST